MTNPLSDLPLGMPIRPLTLGGIMSRSVLVTTTEATLLGLRVAPPVGLLKVTKNPLSPLTLKSSSTWICSVAVDWPSAKVTTPLEAT